MSRLLATLALLMVSLSTLALDRTRIADTPEQISPILNGQFIPDVIVQTEFGKDIKLQSLIEMRPTVILFYRGGWCPYCSRQMAGLLEVEQRIIELGYQIIAISPDTPDRLQEQKLNSDFNMTILSDSKLEAIRGFGLAYFLPEATAQQYRQTLGAKLTTVEGSERFVLPVPAAFVVDTTGLVKFQYANPNYKVRVEPQLLYYAARLAK